MNMEFFDDAREALEKYLPYATENPNVHYLLAESLRFCGDLNKALEEADAVVRLNADDDKGYYVRAAIIKNQEAPLLLGQSMLARMMEFSINNDDMTIGFVTHSPLYNSYDLQCLARLEREAGHHEASAKALSIASEIEENKILAFNAGYQYLLAAKTDDALEMFDKAIQYIDASDEDDKEICRMQMNCYKSRTLAFAGRYEEALPLLEKLEKEFPTEFTYAHRGGQHSLHTGI